MNRARVNGEGVVLFRLDVRVLANDHPLYFPAQELHLRRDNPREFANMVYLNDALGRRSASLTENS